MVTDKNGCVIFGTATVTEPTALDITDVQIDPANNGNSKLTIFATGGTTPYKYKRIPVNANFQGSNIFNNVPEGIYQIVVRDNKLCTDTVEVLVSGGGGGGSNLVQTDETDHLKADEDYEVLEEEIMTIPTNSFNPESVSASQKSLKLFPNPAVNEVNMKVTGDFQEGEIKVFDLQGRLMLRQDLVSNNAIKFDVSTFSDGLYFVKVQLDGEHFTERLFVAEKN